ncbi:MAG: DUF2891 domain-containing protein [Burkholderiales bacterium]
MVLTPDLASSFARLALLNVEREYPAKLDHVMSGPDDARTPRALHPAFYGSFDWHSCVHMHRTLARLRRLFPALPGRGAIDALFDRHLTAANIAAECDYLARPESSAFERTYGWAWLLELARELRGERWHPAVAPLAQAIASRYVEYLPRQRHPLRQGLHQNSAFGLALAIDYAEAAGDTALKAACEDAAVRWFAGDRDAPIGWEPSGIDFLSPALMEADLMRRVLEPAAFARWLDGFLPGGFPLPPVDADDRSDGYLAHLDGLNLSRAWNLEGVARALPADDARIAPLRANAERHVEAGMRGLESGEYAGVHWLASFAVLALAG